jgi:hypothetical protein
MEQETGTDGKYLIRCNNENHRAVLKAVTIRRLLKKGV